MASASLIATPRRSADASRHGKRNPGSVPSWRRLPSSNLARTLPCRPPPSPSFPPGLPGPPLRGRRVDRRRHPHARWRRRETCAAVHGGAERGDIAITVSALGKIGPKTSVDVGAQVSGQLETVHVEIGDPSSRSAARRDRSERVRSRVDADRPRRKPAGATAERRPRWRWRRPSTPATARSRRAA